METPDEVEMQQEMLWEPAPAIQTKCMFEANQAMFLSSNAETDLIQSARQGDLAAFNQLVLIHQDRLYGWVASLVRDDALAGDIAQQTFVSAYEKLSTFRGGSFRAWLFKIARNLSYDEMRKRRRHPQISLDNDSGDDDSIELLSTLPSTTPSPEELVIQSEESGWLFRLLESLPEHFRQALELVDLHEMDYQEVADVLQLPLGTVKSRVARARLNLRAMIVQSRGQM